MDLGAIQPDERREGGREGKLLKSPAFSRGYRVSRDMARLQGTDAGQPGCPWVWSLGEWEGGHLRVGGGGDSARKRGKWKATLLRAWS